MFWKKCPLTAGSRPSLDASIDEYDVQVTNKIGLYQSKHKIDGFQDGRVYLTSNKICYVDNTEPTKRSIYLDLSYIESLEYYVSGLIFL